MSDLVIDRSGKAEDEAEMAPISPFHLPRPTEASERALSQADSIDRRNMLSIIGAAKAKVVYEFLHQNLDAFAVHDKGIYNEMTILDGNLKSRDKEMYKLAQASAKKLAIDCIKKTSIPMRDLDLDGVRIKLCNPLDTQHKINVDIELTKRGIQQYKNSISSGAAFAHEFATSALGMIASTRHVVHMGASILGGSADLLRMRRMKRNAIMISTTAALLVTPALPGSAQFMSQAMHGQNPLTLDNTLHSVSLQDCKPETMFTNGVDTAKFELGAKDSNTSRDQHYLAAMEGGRVGVSPAAMFAVSAFETAGFTDTISNNSTASGAFQMLDGTKMRLIVMYGKQTPTYLDAKKKQADGTAKPDEISFIGALERTLAKGQTRVTADMQNRRVDADMLTLIRSADMPAFSGDLMALYIKNVAPQLTIENLDGKSNAQYTRAIASYYNIHLMGESGGGFFNYVVAHNSNLRVNQTNALSNLYKKYRPGASSAEIARMSGYFADIQSRNPSIFANGANTTFAAANMRIESSMAAVFAKVLPLLNTGETRMEQKVISCNAANDSLITANADRVDAERAAIKHRNELTGYAAAGETITAYYNVTMPAGVRQAAADVTRSAFNTIFGNTAKPTADVSAPEQPQTISDIIKMSSDSGTSTGATQRKKLQVIWSPKTPS